MSRRARRVMLLPSAYFPNIGGIEEVTRQLASGLQRRGIEVAVVTNRWPDSTAARECIEGIDVRRIAFQLPAAHPLLLARAVVRAPGAGAALLREVRSFRPDVLHILGAGPNAVYVAALRRLLRAAIVLGTHGELSGDANDIFRSSTTLRLALRTLCCSADAVTAPSVYTLEEVRARYPVRGLAEVIPNGVSVAEFATAAPRSDGADYVLSVGRLVPQKGFATLIRAFAELRETHGSQRLLIAGEGPSRPALEAEVERLELADAVVLLGAVPRSELPGLYAGAGAAVLASTREAFGLAALEAMAAGAPVVATTAGGIPEVTSNGDAAVLVSPDDPAALAAALRRVLDDPKLRARLKAAGPRAAARYPWDAVVDGHESLYERILPGRGL